MNLFSPSHSVCKECQVHLEPAKGHEARWGHLCPLHRAPVMHFDSTRDAVLSWLGDNKALWRVIFRWYKKKHVVELKAYSARMGDVSAQQTAAMRAAAMQQSQFFR